MDITYIGPSTDFITQAFYDPVDGGLNLDVTTDTPTMIVGVNPDTGWEVTFTGTGLSAVTFSGTVTGMTIRDDLGNTIITFTNFSWPAASLIAALTDLVEIDDNTALNALLNMQPIDINGAGAVDAIAGYLDLDGVTSNADFIGTPFGDWFESGSGNDGIEGGNGNDTLLGSAGSDTILGGAGDDSINGGAGHDSIVGGAGDDRLEGGGGNDTIVAGANNGNEVVVPGAGNDSVVMTGITQGSLDYVTLGHWDLNAGVAFTVDGNANTGTVDKGANGTTTITDIRNPMLANGLGIVGTNFNDSFDITVVDGGWMQVRGGDGADSYQINASTGLVRLDFRDTNVTSGLQINLATGTISDDGFGNTESITGTGDVWEVRGTDLNDSIMGSANDESFAGLAGTDTINGGAGFDRARYDTGANVTGLVVDLGANTATGLANGLAFNHTLTNIEWIRGSNNNDNITGDAGDNRLDGRGGNDRLLGGAGDDTLYGGDGKDRLEGGDNNDNLFGGDLGDLLLGDAGNDTMFGGQGADRLVGGTGDDEMHGGLTADRLLGLDGNDIGFGDEGNDTLRGGNNDDTLSGGAGNDVVIGGTGRDSLTGDADDDILRGNGGFDVADGGAGNDLVAGGAQADNLLGGADNDTVQGGGGFDTIDGGTGDDELTGNFNADQFIFADGHGNDTITDFDATNNAEKIDLSAVTALANIGDVLAAATQVGADVLIDTGGGDSILLQGVILGDLDVNDFTF